MSNISRRSFIQAAGAATVAAGIAGTAIAEEAPAAPLYELDNPPAPIPDDQIAETFTADVVIIGSGPSGLCTAVSCQENGVDVILFSAGTHSVGRGGSHQAFGSKYQKELGIDYGPGSPDSFHTTRHEHYNATFMTDQRKWSRWMLNSGASMDWMIDLMAKHGLKVSLEEGFNDPDGFLTSPPASHNFWNDDMLLGPMNGAPLVSKAYCDEFLENGGRIDWSTRALYLIREDDNKGRVSGVVAVRDDGSYVKYQANKAIVLATGDFSRDRELMQKYAPFAYEAFGDAIEWDNYDYDTGDTFTGIFHGDGHKMGLWVGAAWQHAPVGQMVNSGMLGPRFHYSANFWGINLNRDGKRFMNEITNFAYSADAFMMNPGKVTYFVWDSDYANRNDKWIDWGYVYQEVNGIPARTPEEEVAHWEDFVSSGMYVKADTLEELVEQLDGIDKEAALESIATYNKYAEQGYDEEFQVNPDYLFPIVTPPFYAAKASIATDGSFGVPCLLTICGGLRTDDKMRVCDINDNPIEGLYNVGIMTGDFYANVYSFSLFGQNLGACCTTFPWLLGQDLAKL